MSVLVTYLCAQVWSFWSGANVACACFGAAEIPISWRTMAMPAILAVISLALFLIEKRNIEFAGSQLIDEG